jgi:hypothetical protein
MMRRTLFFTFLGIFVVTFGITASGLIRAWWFDTPTEELLYLRWLIGLTIGEVAAAVVALFYELFNIRRKGEEEQKDPEGQLFETDKQINQFLKDFIIKGSTVDIFSNKLSWVSGDKRVKDFLIEHASKGKEICVYLPKLNTAARSLQQAGVKVITYGSLNVEPTCRFTLINRNIAGSRVLAVGSGVKPQFRIREFTDREHPKVVAMARDLTTILGGVSG